VKPYRSCSCRGPAVIGPDGNKRPGKLLGSKCPDLGKKGHGHWYAGYEAPADPDGKRRQPRLGPFGTEKEAKAALVEALGQVASGQHADDRKTILAQYLGAWMEWKRGTLKPSTATSYAEAIGLYFAPGLGHIKLADLREAHIRELYAAMRKISRAEDDSELMRRLLAARATWHGHRISTRPLTDARIRRMHAVLRTALNDAAIPVNPAARVKLGKVRRTRPLLWTAARVERWQQTGEVPAKVMVWTRKQCGAFLDAVEGQRLYSLFHVAAYYGLRRGELTSLRWADLDLKTRRLHVRGDVKSEDSDREIVIDQGTADVLKTWQEAQLFERLEWGEGWQDTGRVFTRQDGSPLRGGWVSERSGLSLRGPGCRRSPSTGCGTALRRCCLPRAWTSR